MWKFSETAESYDVNLYANYRLPKNLDGVLIINTKNAPPKIDEKRQKLVTSWHHMFDKQPNIKAIIFEDSVDTTHVRSTRCMFANCPNLERIVLPPFAFQNVIDASFMFQNCPKLKEIIAPGLFLMRDIDGSYILNKHIIRYSKRIISDTPIPRMNCPVGLNLICRKF